MGLKIWLGSQLLEIRTKTYISSAHVEWYLVNFRNGHLLWEFCLKLFGMGVKSQIVEMCVHQDEGGYSPGGEEGGVHAVKPSQDSKKLFTKQSPLLFIGCSIFSSNSCQCARPIICVNYDRRSAKVWDNSDESFIGCSSSHQVNLQCNLKLQSLEAFIHMWISRW